MIMIFKKCSLNRFKDIVKNKRLICFGAGKYFYEFCIDKPEIVNNIEFVIDNKQLLHGTYRNINGKLIKICSLAEAMSNIDDSCLFVITTGFENFPAVKEQLDHTAELNYIPLYWGWQILDSPITKSEMRLTAPNNLRLTKKAVIPKIIHYAWFGNSPIPQKFQNFIDGWKRLCTDYEIIEWNERNYDITKNSYMKEAYEAKAYGFVPDYLRKDVVYEYGGVYLDVDVEMIKNIDDLLYQDGFCAFERMHIALGLGFGAKKHLPIIKDLRDQYNNLQFTADSITKSLTGPFYETQLLQERGLKRNGKYQLIERLTVYPSAILNGTDFFTGKKCLHNDTYLIHHYAGSWRDDVGHNNIKYVNEMLSKI